MALRADDVDLIRDRALVEQWQAGDDEAFEDLYRRYFGRLYRFCLRRLHDPHDAEEVTQEAFVRAYRALPNLAGERRFYPWLTVIAGRLCVDARRRVVRHELTPVVDLGTTGDTCEDRVLAADDAAAVVRALGRLTPRHRDVLILREQEGWTYQHIATQLGVNRGAVEALLHRARRALRREFEAVAEHNRSLGAVVASMAWLARRLDRLRRRTTGWETGWAPAVGNAVAAAVVAVGTVTTALTTPGLSGARAVTLEPVAAVGAPAPDGRASAADAGGGAAGDVAAAPDGGEGGSAPTATVGEATEARRLPGGGVLVQGPEAQHRPEQQPTQASAGGVVVGVDPDAVADEGTSTVEHYAGRVEERLGGAQ